MDQKNIDIIEVLRDAERIFCVLMALHSDLENTDILDQALCEQTQWIAELLMVDWSDLVVMVTDKGTIQYLYYGDQDYPPMFVLNDLINLSRAL